MKVSNTAKRLNYLMNTRGLRQVDILDMCKSLSDKTGVRITKSALSQYLSGKVIPGQDKLSLLAQALDVDESWLMGHDVPMNTKQSNAEVTDVKLYNLPVFENAGAGFGKSPQSAPVDYVALPISSESEAREMLCIRVLGDSMLPKIESGDLVVVRRQTSVDSGDLAVVIVDGDEGYIKKVEYNIPPEPDFIRLVSYNPYYPPIVFEGADVQRVSVVGKVKKILRDV